MGYQTAGGLEFKGSSGPAGMCDASGLDGGICAVVAASSELGSGDGDRVATDGAV